MTPAPLPYAPARVQRHLQQQAQNAAGDPVSLSPHFQVDGEGYACARGDADSAAEEAGSSPLGTM
jgi:hypothetical protein